MYSYVCKQRRIFTRTTDEPITKTKQNSKLNDAYKSTNKSKVSTAEQVINFVSKFCLNNE